MMGLESSFFPFPSEVVMIPAGYLIKKEMFSFFLVVLMGVLGSLAGALLNYYLAYTLGRNFLLRYGKFVFFPPKNLEKMEIFFKKHGEISTFLGRLIPGVRQYISLPAGLAKMNLYKFCFFSALGALVWILILVLFGYYLGMILEHHDLDSIISIFFDATPEKIAIRAQLRSISIALILLAGCAIVFYILYQKRKKP